MRSRSTIRSSREMGPVRFLRDAYMRNMSNSPAPTWKKIVAAILDFLTVFIGGGLAIASFTGDTTENGFSLEGGPALLLSA